MFEAVVTEIHLESHDAGRSVWRIALDRTEFELGDTGELEAKARSGAKLIIPVLCVAADSGGKLWHVVEKPVTEGTKIVGRRLPKDSSLVHS
jgi:hypothetical protein